MLCCLFTLIPYHKYNVTNGKKDHFIQKGKAALLSLYNETARLEWRVSPELLRLSTPPHWANLT